MLVDELNTRGTFLWDDLYQDQLSKSISLTDYGASKKTWIVMYLSVHLMYHNQEPITRSLQLHHIPVTAFSQTDLFLV